MSDENNHSGRGPLRQGKQACVNCGQGTHGNTFQGVIVCDTCFGMVKAFVHQVDSQIEFVRQILMESTRVALLERNFGTRQIPETGEVKAPSADEVQAALSQIFRPLTGNGPRG